MRPEAHRHARAAALLLLPPGLACQEAMPPDPAPVIWSGDLVEVATNDDALACAGSYDYLDRFTAALNEELDLSAADEPLRYYLLTTEELDALDFCPDGAQCIKQHRVYTDRAIDTHELVHAARTASLGEPLPGITYFEEGLAVMFQHSERVVDVNKDVYAGLEAVDDLDAYLPGEHYGVAGHFSRFLENEAGVQTLSEFIGAQAGATTVDQVEERFDAAYGEALQEAVARYQADYPFCSDLARTKHLVGCEQPPVDPTDGQIVVEVDLSCDDPDTLGPTAGRMWRTFAFNVVNEGNYRITNGVMPFDFRAEVVDCDRGCLGSVDLDFDDEASIFMNAELRPGRYLVRLSRSVEAPGPARVQIAGFD